MLETGAISIKNLMEKNEMCLLRIISDDHKNNINFR